MKAFRLVNLSRPVMELIVGNVGRFSETMDISVGKNSRMVEELARNGLDILARNRIAAKWWGYLGVDGDTRSVVGTCAFKGPPKENGEVEITYFTFPSFEGRGFGTLMASGLIERARRDRRVRKIIAHTFPAPGPSTKILEKLGMTCQGPVDHPSDGRVWRWTLELQKPTNEQKITKKKQGIRETLGF